MAFLILEAGTPVAPLRRHGGFPHWIRVAAGLGARAVLARTAKEVRDALADTRDHPGRVVIVVPAIPHADLQPSIVPTGVATLCLTDQDNT